MIPVSVLILTRDEEINLPRCLDSLENFDDVVVLDSNSTDRTREIAEAAGARVVVRAFDDYARQRNFGLTGITYRNDWLLMVDADETVPEALCREIGLAIEQASGVSQFRMRRKDYFMDRWIRRSIGAAWFGRLMRIGDVRVVRDVNEQYETGGETRNLEGFLHHFPFAKGFEHWLDKHNRYSSMEAAIMQHDSHGTIEWKELFAADVLTRRKTLKAVAQRFVPARPLLYFFWLYVRHAGFLEGRAGLRYCLLKAYAEFITDCKYDELRRRGHLHRIADAQLSSSSAGVAHGPLQRRC